MRDSLLRLFRTVGPQSLTYSSAQEFLDDVNARYFSCLVLDVRMPGMSGIELLKLLALRGNLTPVILISGHGDVNMAVDAMRSGAFDFLEKPIREQDLLDRVRRAMEVDRVIRAREIRKGTIRSLWTSLTEREREVLRLMIRGQPNKTMAISLRVSQRTVEIRRARVMEKMRADSLAQLIRMAAEIDIPDADNDARPL